MRLNITLRLQQKSFYCSKTDLCIAVLELKMLETHVIVVIWWVWPIVKQLCLISPAVALEKLRQLSEPAALETLSQYFDATRDSDSQRNFLTGMHCFKSAADRFSWRCMKSKTPILTGLSEQPDLRKGILKQGFKKKKTPGGFLTFKLF